MKGAVVRHSSSKPRTRFRIVRLTWLTPFRSQTCSRNLSPGSSLNGRRGKWPITVQTETILVNSFRKHSFNNASKKIKFLSHIFPQKLQIFRSHERRAVSLWINFMSQINNDHTAHKERTKGRETQQQKTENREKNGAQLLKQRLCVPVSHFT